MSKFLSLTPGGVIQTKESDLYKTRVHFRTDFVSSGLDLDTNSDWIIDTFGNGSAADLINAQGGQVQLTAGAGNGRYSEIIWNYNVCSADDNVTVEFYSKIDTTTSFFCTWGLWENGGHAAYFLVADGGTYFEAYTENAGGSTQTATSITLDTNFHWFKIVTTSTDVKFYIDDILEVTITTNIPVNEMRLDFYNESQAGGSVRIFLIDFVDFEMDRM